MSLHSYQHWQEVLRREDHPFSSLIFAAMYRADSRNIERLRAAFPELYEEFQARYNSPGGRLQQDSTEPRERNIRLL